MLRMCYEGVDSCPFEKVEVHDGLEAIVPMGACTFRERHDFQLSAAGRGHTQCTLHVSSNMDDSPQVTPPGSTAAPVSKS